MAYVLSYVQHHALIDVLIPYLQEASEPKLTIPEAALAASALVDLLAPAIGKLIDEAVVAEGKRITLATGRG